MHYCFYKKDAGESSGIFSYIFYVMVRSPLCSYQNATPA